jgi:hypothetical protein
MRFSMAILKNERSVYIVRNKVPRDLQEAVANVLGNGKERQTFLQQLPEDQGRRGSEAQSSCRADALQHRPGARQRAC